MVYRLVINQKQDERIILTPEQQHYLKRVLRMGEGDRFIAMDGKGHSWLARISGTEATIIEPLNQVTELKVAVSLMVALPKGDGFEQIVRCCTELGVSSFIPVMSDRTLLKPSSHKLERWRKIAKEAAEQSERQLVPTILEPVDFSQALERSRDLEADCYICAARADAPHLLKFLETKSHSNITIATGPEGGWTEAELEKAVASGFQPVSLGRRILRAVTAPIVALSLAASVVEK